ncbi:MAG: DUF1552 domain-containing protein [Planctomycetes bacterium]|nr:DUF1552 domain-containing protein [Planctomycetota bacterium]
MSRANPIPRRTFLRGLGTAVALPLLDAMMPTRVFAAGASAGQTPIRMAFLFVPNGMHMPDWTPAREGPNFDFPKILQALRPVKRDLLVLSGLTHDKGRGNGDGPGDHARSAGVFLTGVQPLKSEGAEVRAGVSVDQKVAKQIGHLTRFPSLEIGTEKGRQSGKCDSGYACPYSNNISWRDAATPMTKEVSPRAAFERLFAGDLGREVSERQARRRLFKKSILDFVLEDAHALSGKVGGRDRVKLDEYLSAVREIERRIERAESETRDRSTVVSGQAPPEETPSSYEEHIRLMGDVMILAFQADVTRVCTFMLANEGSNRSYRFIGVNEGHHTLSHHQNDPVKLGKISNINEFHAKQFAYVVQRMKSIPEGDGSLLDNCMILYGAGISDGNRHNNENLPIVIAGKAGGTIRTGRHVRYDFETPMSNLFLSMMDRMGVHADTFGDSTGRLRGLEA